MEQTLLHFDQERFTKKKGALNFHLVFINKAIEIFDSFDLGKFEPGDLHELLQEPESFVKQKVKENRDIKPLLEMGLDERKLDSMLSMPERLNDLLEAAEKANGIFQTEIQSLFNFSDIRILYRDYYQFNNERKFVIKEQILDRLKANSETYIECEAAKSMFNFGNQIISLFEKYKVSTATKNDFKILVDRLFEVNSGKISVNRNYISEIERYAKK